MSGVRVTAGSIAVEEIAMTHDNKYVKEFMVECLSKHPEVTIAALDEIHLHTGEQTQGASGEAKSTVLHIEIDDEAFDISSSHIMVDARGYNVYIVYLAESDDYQVVWPEE